jgi:hypothetical protein
MGLGASKRNRANGPYLRDPREKREQDVSQPKRAKGGQKMVIMVTSTII